MKTQFDLEQRIMDCWGVVDDIQLVYENLLDGDPKPTEDYIANNLLGMKQLYDMRFNKLFSTFEKLLKEQHESQVCDNSEVLRQEKQVTISSY